MENLHSIPYRYPMDLYPEQNGLRQPELTQILP